MVGQSEVEVGFRHDFHRKWTRSSWSDAQRGILVQKGFINYCWGYKTFQSASHHISMSYTYKVFEHLLLQQWMNKWIRAHIITNTNVSQDLGRLSEIQVQGAVSMQQMMPLHYGWGCITPFKLHSTSTSYMDKEFKHCVLWWMNVWLRTHTMFLQIWVSEILGDVSMQMMPLRYGWGCIFQTAYNIQVIHT